MAVARTDRRLYVQPRMFATDGPCPTMATLNVATVDGVWTIGATVIDLASLEPLAITATPGQQALDARADAHAFLDDLLDVQLELGALGPFA